MLSGASSRIVFSFGCDVPPRTGSATRAAAAKRAKIANMADNCIVVFVLGGPGCVERLSLCPVLRSGHRANKTLAHLQVWQRNTLRANQRLAGMGSFKHW